MVTVARNAKSIIFPRHLFQPLIDGIRSGFPPLFTGMIAWEIGGRILQYSFLPPFSNVVRAAVELILTGQIVNYLASSLVSLLVGYALAVGLGIVLGLLMGRYRKIEYICDPYITAFLAVPKIALVPVLFALFGLSRNIQIAVVFLSAFFIIVITTMSAVRTVDAGYVDMARAFGATERQLFWKVFLPGAMPLTLAGLRLGIGRAVRGMINGEMYIAIFGLGGLLRTYGNRFDAEKVFAILLIVIVVALICTAVVQAIGYSLTRWMEPAT